MGVHHYKQLLNLWGGGANETFGITLPLGFLNFFLFFLVISGFFRVYANKKKVRESSFWQWSPGKYCHILLYYILRDHAEVSQPGCSSETPGELGQNTDSQTQPPEMGISRFRARPRNIHFYKDPHMILMSLILCLRTIDKYSEREKNVENDITLKNWKVKFLCSWWLS